MNTTRISAFAFAPPLAPPAPAPPPPPATHTLLSSLLASLLAGAALLTATWSSSSSASSTPGTASLASPMDVLALVWQPPLPWPLVYVRAEPASSTDVPADGDVSTAGPVHVPPHGRSNGRAAPRPPLPRRGCVPWVSRAPTPSLAGAHASLPLLQSSPARSTSTPPRSASRARPRPRP